MFQVSLDVLLQEALWVLNLRLNDSDQGLGVTKQTFRTLRVRGGGELRRGQEEEDASMTAAGCISKGGRNRKCSLWCCLRVDGLNLELSPSC